MAPVDRALLPPNEPQRLDAIRRYDILDTPPDGAFDRITALAARLFEVPIAIVSIVDHDRIWFKSHHGLGVEEIPREPGLCASAILQDAPWVIEDAPRDPRALANPLVAGEFGLKFYAGVPLRTGDGFNLGTLCILDFKPRELTPEETSTLEDLAATVMSELELRLATRHALARARERETIKDAFVGMMSHELRTPVTTIYAAAQILARSDAIAADPRARDLFPDILSESERLLRVIENLLVLTRLEQGRLEARSEPVLLQHVIRRSVEHVSRRSDGRSIGVDVPRGLPPVAGDPTYIEQVLDNLLSNAVKYSPPETEIEIGAAVDGDAVEVSVRDRGMGLGTDRGEKIFDLLVRTDEAARVAPGAGIGLYVCRRLLDSMGGAIWAAPRVDGGTTFVFRLPVADD